MQTQDKIIINDTRSNGCRIQVRITPVEFEDELSQIASLINSNRVSHWKEAEEKLHAAKRRWGNDEELLKLQMNLVCKDRYADGVICDD